MPPCVATARLDRLLLQAPRSAVAVRQGRGLILWHQFAASVKRASGVTTSMPLQLPLAQTVTPARSVRLQVHLYVKTAKLVHSVPQRVLPPLPLVKIVTLGRSAPRLVLRPLRYAKTA